jgi:hypothetical protein
MSNRVTKLAALLLFFLLIACSQKEKEIRQRRNKILKISKNVIGGNFEYDRIYKQCSDSLNTWCLGKEKGYQSIWSYSYRLDSVLCFNSERDRMVTAILIQCDLSTCEMDNIEYFYGAKIKGQWYFFTGGSVMAVLRENYQSDIHLPLSFQKLHELAMDNMFRGYVKKGKEGTWQINDAFFTSLMENVGWGDFNKQSHRDTVAYGKRFTNRKEYFESIYMGIVKSFWLKPQDKLDQLHH